MAEQTSDEILQGGDALCLTERTNTPQTSGCSEAPVPAEGAGATASRVLPTQQVRTIAEYEEELARINPLTECPCRKALERIVGEGHTAGCVQAYGRDACDCTYGIAEAALSAPCPLEAENARLEAELVRLRAINTDVGIWLVGSIGERDEAIRTRTLAQETKRAAEDKFAEAARIAILQAQQLHRLRAELETAALLKEHPEVKP